ncbi:hypothetical protein FAGKG844_10078 [Frankia sp. AgKG'84/4]
MAAAGVIGTVTQTADHTLRLSY